MTKAETVKEKIAQAKRHLADIRRVRHQGRRLAGVKEDARIKRARPTFHEDVVLPWRKEQRAKWKPQTDQVLNEIRDVLAPGWSPEERIRRATLAPPPEKATRDGSTDDRAAIELRNLMRIMIGEQRELNLTNQLRAASAETLKGYVADARRTINDGRMKFVLLEHERRTRMKEYPPPLAGRDIGEQSIVDTAIKAALRDWPLPADEQEALPLLDELTEVGKDLAEAFAEVWDGKPRVDRDEIRNNRLPPREAEEQRRALKMALTRDIDTDVRTLLKAQIDDESAVA